MSLSILSKNFKATISIDKQTEFITISLKSWPPTLAFISNIGVNRWSIRAILKVNANKVKLLLLYVVTRKQQTQQIGSSGIRQISWQMELYWIYAVLTEKRAKKLKKQPPPLPEEKKLGFTCKQTLTLCGNAVKLFSFLSKRALNVLFLNEVRLW